MRPVVYPPEENVADEQKKFLKEYGPFWRQELKEMQRQRSEAKQHQKQ
jgi:hypothetical protein